MILAGFVGGSKTALGLFEANGAGLQCLREQRFACAEYASFEAILEAFLAAEPELEIEAACVGVAGVVEHGRCNATNLPWQVSEAAIARITGAARVRLWNDLEAAAHGMLFLRDDQLAVLQAGKSADRRGHIAVIAAGTGLGEALLFFDGERHHPMPTEGGHADFAPRSDLEAELLRHLRARHGEHVAIERVLSGPGLVELYRFLRQRSTQPEPAGLQRALGQDEGAAVITRAALAGEDPVCEQALDLFVSIYGAEAGNLALRSLPRGGVFVGGGIAPQILPALQSGRFLEAFTSKGFFEEYLRGIRVSVALEPRAPLIGSAHYALRL
jgi:glucokinase